MIHYALRRDYGLFLRPSEHQPMTVGGPSKALWPSLIFGVSEHKPELAEDLGDMTASPQVHPPVTDAIDVRRALDELVAPIGGVEVLYGMDGGKRCAFRGRPVVVGSSMAADLQLRDPTVSRFHVRLVPRGNEVEVIDLGSRNGVFLGEHRMGHGFLTADTTLRVGRTLLRVNSSEESPKMRAELAEVHGRSPATRRLYAQLIGLAHKTTPVVIVGQPGVGKNRVARALHGMSPQCQAPLRFFDASMIHGPGDLPDLQPGGSVVFGGCQHLSEPGIVALESLIAAGGASRLIMAYTEDAREEANAEAEEFLRTVIRDRSGDRINVPSLSERMQDFPILVGQLLADLGRPDFELGPEDLGALQAQSFAENLRGLKEALRCRLEREGGLRGVAPRNSTERIVGVERPYKEARAEMLASFERTYTEALLSRHQGNVSRAARAAGIDRVYLHRLMKKHSVVKH